MQFKYFLLPYCLILVFCVSFLFAETTEEGKIKIAIMKFQLRGDATEKEVEVFSEFIRSKIEETKVFSVIERGQVDDLLEEHSIQLSGIVDTGNTENLIEFGRISAVRMLLIGTIGRLYGQVIITVRLVNAESGEVVFANTLYSPKEKILGNIKRLASEIADNGLLFRTQVTLEDIEASIKDKKYRTALQRIQRFMDTNNQIDENILERRRFVEAELAEKNLKEAGKALRRKYFREAQDLINEAIILDGKEKYYQYRDKIIEKQEEYQRREASRLERKKQKMQEDQAKVEAGYLNFWDQLDQYYNNITASGFHLGTSTGIEVSEQYALGSLFSWWGGEFLYIGECRGLNDFVNNIWYGGIHGRYQDVGNGYYALALRPYLSPFVGFNIQIANLILNLGADVGAVINLNNLIPKGYELGMAVGVMAVAEFKFLKSLGLFSALKVDYEWIFDPGYRREIMPRLIAGIVF